MRRCREEKSRLQRVVAAAADMDHSHYSKIESGKKFPSDAQAAAIIRVLTLSADEFRKRMKADQILQLCGGDAALVTEAASIVQEQTPARFVNKHK